MAVTASSPRLARRLAWPALVLCLTMSPAITRAAEPIPVAAAAAPSAQGPAAALEPVVPGLDKPGPGDPAFEGPDEMSLGWTLVRTLVVLGLVVGLAWLTLNVGLRRLMGLQGPAPGRALVSVLERVPLDQKRSLFVVRAAGEVLLIGGGDSALALIAKLDAAEVERIRSAATPTNPIQLSPFLQKLLGRKDAPPPPAT